MVSREHKFQNAWFTVLATPDAANAVSGAWQD
jgi:hypothetical protein